MTRSRILAVLGLNLVVLSAFCSGRLSAQEAERGGGAPRVRVLIALVTDSVFQGDLTIVRRPRGVERNIIVMHENAATSSRLGAAAMALAGLIATDGDVVDTEVAYRLPPETIAPESEIRAALKVMLEARRSPIRVLPGIGHARTAIIELPSQSVLEARRQAGRQGFGQRRP